ncbi:MAG: hypothetical protein OEZ37_06930, partial [Gemmatimonadota bacterium]|nr:hypothetical protein [Gemmatimonadota bacterium]
GHDEPRDMSAGSAILPRAPRSAVSSMTAGCGYAAVVRGVSRSVSGWISAGAGDVLLLLMAGAVSVHLLPIATVEVHS